MRFARFFLFTWDSVLRRTSISILEEIEKGKPYDEGSFSKCYLSNNLFTIQCPSFFFLKIGSRLRCYCIQSLDERVFYTPDPVSILKIRLMEGGNVTSKFSKGIFVVLVRTEKKWRSYVVIYGFKWKAYIIVRCNFTRRARCIIMYLL